MGLGLQWRDAGILQRLNREEYQKSNGGKREKGMESSFWKLTVLPIKKISKVLAREEGGSRGGRGFKQRVKLGIEQDSE